jgi:AcrR family transcriptional regulator
MARQMKKNARGPRGEKTREKLLAAGRKAFAAKGLGGASLREDILRPAGLSAGSFYHQFPDKASLLAEIVRTDGGRLIEAMKSFHEQGDGGDPAARASTGLDRLFDRAENNPDFVKIFVREYYSESPAVQREIRRHSQNTMAALRLLYDRLGAATGIRLDSESLSVVVSSQIFSLLNYYLGMSRRERAEARPRLRRAVMQLMVGGVLAVRLPEEEATQESAASVADSASD